MKQLTLAAVGFERYAKTTRRGAFLAEMERVVPWSALCALIEPFYPKPGNGRPPIGVERMLRIYFLQQWFNLSDPAVEEALYDSSAMRRFVDIDFGREPAPDETTVCRFRHLLEAHDLGQQLFDEVQRHLASKGLKVATGTIVDATIINAPSSTKNADKARDPEMHQTKKGNQWYFGMKAHFGIDSRTKLIHAVVATPANVADSTVLPELLHGEETRVWGDQAYRGQRAVIREHAPKARDFTNRRYRHRGVVDEVERAKNRTKSKVRARVEHVIGGCQAGVRLCQGVLSRAEQEQTSPAGDLRTGQSVHRAPASTALPTGVVCPHHAGTPCNPPVSHQPAPFRPVTAASEQVSRPWATLQPLVQIFPNGHSGRPSQRHYR
jgi:transposase, IS5 family